MSIAKFHPVLANMLLNFQYQAYGYNSSKNEHNEGGVVHVQLR